MCKIHTLGILGIITKAILLKAIHINFRVFFFDEKSIFLMNKMFEHTMDKK